MAVPDVIQAFGLPGRVPGGGPGLQSPEMRARGLGWRAEPCPDPPGCELHLCVPDDNGHHWHPVDPLAFAKWRVRATLDAMPAHVVVRAGRLSGPSPTRRLPVGTGVLLGALGLGGTAAALAVWLARHAQKQRACSA